jgi:hypothetical protein
MKTILKWFAISLIALASINFDTLSNSFIENIEIINSIISIDSLVKKHSKKVTFKNSKNHKYEFKNTFYPFKDLDFKDYLIKLISESGLIKNQKIGIITQFRDENGDVITIGSRYPLLITESPLENDYLSEYSEILTTKYELLENWYKNLIVTEIIFNYSLITDQDYDRMINKEQTNVTNIIKEVQMLESNEILSLPIDMIYTSWGNSYSRIDGNSYKVSDLHNSLSKKHIIVTEINKNNYEIQVYLNELLVITFVDRKINNHEFIRFTENKVYYIKDKKIYFFFDSSHNLKNISKLRKMKDLDLNMITLDTETYTDENGNMQVYCICMYDGKDSSSYYLTDYKDNTKMIQALFKKLLTRKYAWKSIFIHNSSNFDMIFL